MDLNNIANMAQQAGNLANNPIAQQILNNDAIEGFVNQAEEMTNIDLNGNGSVGSSSQSQVSDQADQIEESSVTEE
jgi:hypothetical protein